MILSLSLVAAAARAQPGDAQPLRRVVALLDYVSGDYARAVGEHGEVLSEAEHAEQIGFVQDAARELRADVNGKGEDLARQLDALRRRIEDRAPPAFDSGLSDEDRWDVAFHVLALAHPKASAHGMELARAALLPTRYADLATLSDDELRVRLVAAGLGPAEQEEALAALRAGPFA